MAAPVVMSIEQVAEGHVQLILVPQMVPCCFVAAPKFCGGMWVLPSGSCKAMRPQGVHMGTLDAQQGRYNRSSRKTGQLPPSTAMPNPYFGGGLLWPKQDASSEEPVAVELSSLPKMLCNRQCLEAAIEQAGLENDIQALEVEQIKIGKAVLIMATEQAAQRCIYHFHGLQWAKRSKPVAARYCQQPPSQDQPEDILASPVASVKSSATATRPSQEDQVKKVKSRASKATDQVNKTVVRPVVTPKGETGACSSACSSPTCKSSSSPMNQQPKRSRWADIESDDGEDDAQFTSTFAGSSDEFHSSSDGGDLSNAES